MGMLTDWIKGASEITTESNQARDICTNERIREIFFEQIENLAFTAKELGSMNGKKTYELGLKLDFPLKKQAPYKFLFETCTRTLVPQYTDTHRVYKAARDSREDIILSNLEAYLLQYPNNSYSKNNPEKEREHANTFGMVHADKINDLIRFDVNGENMAFDLAELDGHVVIYYRNDVVAYQLGKDFIMLPEYRNVRIHVTKTTGHVIYDLYNYPEKANEANKYKLMIKY